MAATNNKDTIYIDIDDEITTVIDKVRSSPSRIIALVLPKRAAVFQSIVNMKLLKRTADSAKKKLVLITSEAGLLPLAGAVGLHVAATPQSRPEVPSASAGSAAAEDVAYDASSESEAYTAANAGNRPIGELAGMTGSQEGMETLSLPEEDQPDDEQADVPAADKPKKTKTLKIPNFNKFRLRLFLGVLLLAGAIVGLYYAMVVLPKATVDISTKTSDVNVNLTAALNPSAQALDTNKSVVPAKIEQQQKTTTQQIAASGQKNNGVAATGTVTLTACETTPSFPASVAAGTGLTVNGLVFITQTATSFKHSGVSNGTCFAYQATGDTSVAAQSAGAKYNVSNASFTVAGRSDVTGTGSASGGTDDIVHIVTQADIDSAKQKLASADSSAIKDALQQALRQDGRYPLPATFNAGAPVITQTNQPGDQADNVTVTQAITYTMYGAMRSDLESLIKAKVSSSVDTHGQSIADDGLDKSTVAVTDSTNGTDQISLQTTAVVGPDIHPDDIKKQIAGKKAGDVKLLVTNLPGVTVVDVRLSPFWVSSVPTNQNKITVTVHGAK